VNRIRLPGSAAGQTPSPGARVAAALLAAGFLVGAGWLVSANRFGLLTALLVATGFVAVVLIEDAVLIALPLAMILPNLGLDVPGPFAVLMWDAFAAGFVGGVVARRVLRRRPLLVVDPWFRRLLLLFVGVAAASLLQGVLGGAGVLLSGLKEWIRLVELALLVVALSGELSTTQRVLALARNLLIAGVASLAIALVAHFWFADPFYRVMTLERTYVLLGAFRLRMISTAGNVAETGMFFLMLAGMAAYFARRGPAAARPLALLATAAFLTAVALTYNKGTWLALPVGLGMVVLRGGMRRRGIALAGIAVLFAVGLLFVRVPAGGEVGGFATDLAAVTRSSGLLRFQRWLALQNVLTRHPLLGVGYNTFAHVYGEYSIEPGAGHPYGHPHNLYVDVLAGTGLLGFAAFAAMGARLLRLSVRNLRDVRDPRLRALSLALHGVLWFFLAGNLATSFLYKPVHPAYLTATVAAMVLAIRRLGASDPGAAAPGLPAPA
jgi:O-antigen ligase